MRTYLPFNQRISLPVGRRTLLDSVDPSTGLAIGADFARCGAGRADYWQFKSADRCISIRPWFGHETRSARA